MELSDLNKAINFLISASTYIESKQTNAGGWLFGEKKRECCYITAQGILALGKTRNPKELRLIKAAEFLKKKRNPDYGWGRDPDPKTSDIQSTSLCCLAIKNILGETDEVTQGINWVIEKQNTSGSFKDFIMREEGTVKATTHALYALGYFKGKVAEEVIKNALKWLEENQTVEGGWGNIPTQSASSACTASVLECITEHGWHNLFDKKKFEDAKGWLIRSRVGSGFFPDMHQHYDTEATAYAIISLLNYGYSPEEATISEPFNWLVSRQNVDGSVAEENGGVVSDICPAADGINVISKWLNKYIENHPFILVENLEYLSSLEFGAKSKNVDRFLKTEEERTRAFIIDLKVFRHEWGKKQKFEIKS